MSIDVEQQIANYFEWLDLSSGKTLHRPADDVDLDGGEAEVIAVPHGVSRGSRRWLIVAAAAAVVLVAIALVVLRDHAPNGRLATGQVPMAEASWYVIDPTGSYGNLSDGTDVDLGDRLACRHYDASTATCTELVGQKSVSYALDGGQQVTVITDVGQEPSTMWQALQVGATAGPIAGHSGLINSSGTMVGFEASAGTRVVVMGSPPTSVQTLTDIAAALSLVHETVAVPIVFGESAPRVGEFPFDSVGARYYAGYVDLAESCVGSFGVPWNNEAKCVPVDEDKVTVTVASPSPAGTILIAALPAATASVEITLQDTALSTAPVTVPGFAPKLLFTDLDGAIPSHLTAFDSSHAVIGQADVVSTGGAALGYLSVDPGSLPRTYYSTEHPMKEWPHAASSRPYTSNGGYGMAPCDSGSWTKFAVLASATRWEHSYQGTLCTFTTLGHPIGDTVASCSSMSPGTNYAQCKVLPASKDDAIPNGTDNSEPAEDMEPEDAALLPATSADLPQIFGDQISAVSLVESDQYSDNSVSVTLSKSVDPGVTCFRINLADASSEGCLDAFLLTTGLAYGAFERGDGPIEVVGIVPDDAVSVQINGRSIAVHNNVWHYTGQRGDDLSFIVTSTNGSIVATLR